MQQMIQEHDRLKANEKKFKETCQIELEKIEAEFA